MKITKIILVSLFVIATIFNVVLLDTNVYNGKYSNVEDDSVYIDINENVITSSDFFIGAIYESDKEGISYRYMKWSGDLAHLNGSLQRKSVFRLESIHYEGTEKITSIYKCHEAISLCILYSSIMFLSAGAFFYINCRKPKKDSM